MSKFKRKYTNFEKIADFEALFLKKEAADYMIYGLILCRNTSESFILKEIKIGPQPQASRTNI